MSSNFLAFQVEIKPQEQIDLARDLAVLLKSGITINESVRMLREEARSAAMKKLLDEVIIDLEKGNPLSITLQKSSVRLKSVFISMVKAGEVSGSLVNNLLFLADWMERNLQLKRDIKSVT
ncbi:MAG TPA: type II secretion system F family protein, partial [Candidatus Paceibacterota bacterium]|nr:type II secretion system F family protein [Candidatus Paceibacterota bacterium]